MSIESRWATWLWRWSVGQAVVGVIALAAAFVPAARLGGATGWVVLGAVLAVAITGTVLAVGGFFGGLATMPTGRVSETEWSRLSLAQRRSLARAVRRGTEIDPGQRELARWHAERSIRGALPQACLQGALGVMWLGNSLTDEVGDGLWWFHTVLGTLQVAFALAVLWVIGRRRASLARLHGEPAPSVAYALAAPTYRWTRHGPAGGGLALLPGDQEHRTQDRRLMNPASGALDLHRGRASRSTPSARSNAVLVSGPNR